jgi:hypothetical protein
MQKTLFAFVVFSILSIGLSAAFADSYEETVRIPIPDNATKTLDRCTLVERTDNTVRFNCAWEFEAENVEEWYEEMTASSTPESEETETEEIIEEQVKPQVDIPKTLKPYVQDLERLKENPPNRVSDKEYLELLKYLAECQRGYNESYGIQKTDSFAISQTWINENEAWLKSIDLTGRHGELRKNIEACIAQRTILNPVILGEYTLHKGQFFGQTQQHHSDNPTIKDEHLASFAVYDKLTVRDFEQEKRNAQDTLCNIASSFRLDYCINKINVNVGGVVSFQNDAEDRWLQYKEDGGKQMARELAAEKLREKQQQLMEMMKKLND